MRQKLDFCNNPELLEESGISAEEVRVQTNENAVRLFRLEEGRFRN